MSQWRARSSVINMTRSSGVIDVNYGSEWSEERAKNRKKKGSRKKRNIGVCKIAPRCDSLY